MAGEVRLRAFCGAQGVVTLDPQPCPAAASELHRPSCVKASISDGHENWCPFAMALVLRRAGTIYDLDRGAHIRVWLTDYASELDQWSVICLRRESAYTRIGAELRP